MKKTIFLILFMFTVIASSVNAQETTYKIGDVVSNFSLKNIDSDYIDLDHFNKAKGVVVIFTCNHCPYAQAYEQRIIDFNNKYGRLGYPVLAINPNDPKVQPEDSFEKMIERSKEKNYTYPYVFDETQEVAKKFAATKTPHVFVLKNNNGEFVLSYIGAIDDNSESASAVTKKYLEDAILSLEKGKKPEPQMTKAVGCTIKWKK